MALADDLVCLVHCQCNGLDGNGDMIPQLATDRRFAPAVVPAGEVWHINRLEIANSSAATASNTYVWTPPNDDQINATDTQWLWVPTITVAVNTVEVREGSKGAEVLLILEAGSSIWVGDDSGIKPNVIILGWRYPAP